MSTVMVCRNHLLTCHLSSQCIAMCRVDCLRVRARGWDLIHWLIISHDR